MNYFRYIFIVFVFVFIANILVYLSSEDYRYMIKKIKYENNIESFAHKQGLILEQKANISFETITGGVNLASQEKQVIQESDNTNKKNNQEFSLYKTDKEFLLIFNSFSLLKDSFNSILFDLESTYDYYYMSYSSPKMTLYIFGSASRYNDLKKKFEFNNLVEIKETNNFFSKSFYINSKDQDDFIRLVLTKNDRTFGLKIKRDYYNEVKTILEK